MNDIHSNGRRVRYQRTKKSSSHITVREFQADGWNVREIEVSSFEEYLEEEMEVEEQNWDRDDPEFWELLFAQRPSWERK
jgi:hypothetical protein